MLKDPVVNKVSVNSETGECKIFMHNGEMYKEKYIYYPEDLLEYIDMLHKEDMMVFDLNTNWVLTTCDVLEEWEVAFQKLGAYDVQMIRCKNAAGL